MLLFILLWLLFVVVCVPLVGLAMFILDVLSIACLWI